METRYIVNQVLDPNSHILFHEDCLRTMERFPSSLVDLVYVDPPFFTGRTFESGGNEFNDKWDGLSEYLKWFEPRIKEFKRILKPSGTIYIHCDWHASHYLKVLSDSIFGYKNFLNEIIFQRQSSHNDTRQGSRHHGRIHDTILVYTMSSKYIWNQQYLTYDKTYEKHTYRFLEKKTCRKYALGDLTAPGGASKKNAKYEFLGVERYWRYSRVKMNELLVNDKISQKKGRVPLLKRYLDEMKGKPIQDIWADIKPVANSYENLQYPTQKPEALLDRIINTSTNPNQIVYDPFAGSGTSGAVCFRLSRRWIGSEISENACHLTLNRLKTLDCGVKFLSL